MLHLCKLGNKYNLYLLPNLLMSTPRQEKVAASNQTTKSEPFHSVDAVRYEPVQGKQQVTGDYKDIYNNIEPIRNGSKQPCDPKKQFLLGIKADSGNSYIVTIFDSTKDNKPIEGTGRQYFFYSSGRMDTDTNNSNNKTRVSNDTQLMRQFFCGKAAGQTA